MGFEDTRGTRKADALPWRPDRRVHVGAVDQAKDTLGLLRTPHFVEDEEGLHDGAMANIFTPDGENFTIVLENGEHLPNEGNAYSAEQAVKIFERRGPISAAEVQAGDYVDYNGRKRLATDHAMPDVTGERVAQIPLKDLGLVDFFKDDPSSHNLTIYREIEV